MLAASVPEESVVAEFWLTVPSPEFTLIAAFGTGLPFESVAATKSNQGPPWEPTYAGVPRITRWAATTVGGVIVNGAAEDVPPPGAGVTTVTKAVPADTSSALGTAAVSCVEETKVV